ncbi:MAG: hypothetical protein IJ092_06155 [Atopobiaceae bacterium]|nr:hypothetical protein [Atopobiaceae bacterium]MBR1828982.1 hypothetical protein [Atopobiaceae bacterium]
MSSDQADIPSWLTQSQDYVPSPDRDAFLTKSALSVSSVLAQLRLDDGRETQLSPSAPVKLVFCLVCIILVSLSRNYLFVVVMLAGVLLRAATLPKTALSRVVGTAAGAAGLALVLMLPASLLGQPQSALTMAGKALVSTGLAMELALTTPASQLTGAMRTFGVPNIVILTIDLALRSIVQLGKVALEALNALTLRSVGKNANKQASIGGVGGVVLVKAGEAAQATHDAMRCRGFEGDYDATPKQPFRTIDWAWLALLALLVTLFVYLQGLV